MNIFDQSKTVQCCFWYMLFNFMTPIKCEIEMTTARRKILTIRYCRKSGRILQNVFRSLEKSGLLLQTSKNKHITYYAVPLISSTKNFTNSYTSLNSDYLELMHDIQIEAIKLALKSSNRKIDPSKIREKIFSQLSDDVIDKISFYVFFHK